MLVLQADREVVVVELRLLGLSATKTTPLCCVRINKVSTLPRALVY